MSPVSLASQTPENNKTNSKIRITPIDDVLKVLKKRRTNLKEEESSEESETYSEDNDASHKESSEESEAYSEDNDASNKESIEESETISEDDDDPSYGVKRKRKVALSLKRNKYAKTQKKKAKTQKEKKESSEESETYSEDNDTSHEESSEESETYSEDNDASHKESSEEGEAYSEDNDASNKESSEESETISEDDDDDPSYGVKRKRKVALSPKRNKHAKTQKKKAKTQKKKATAVMSAYEKMIEEKKAEKLAFLESLKMNEVKADFTKSVRTISKKSKPAKRTPSPQLPTRHSRRLAIMRDSSLSFSEDNLYNQAEINNAESKEMPIPSKMIFSDAFCSLYEQKYESYAEDINVQMPNSTGKHLSYSKSILQNLTLKEDNIIKVVPERITGLSWYPSADHLILAAGSKLGNIGIWNAESKSCPYTFKIHNGGSTCLQFNPFNPVHLFSSSYEGVLRRGDMVKHLFTEVYNVSNEAGCTYFDFLSPTTYLVALKNGDIAIVDQRRELRVTEKRHTCHRTSIKSVSIHPVDKNFFVTAANKGPVRLWDLRKLQKDPVADINNHTKCVNSAFFSPLTGNSILTTSFDDSICIYDSTKLTADIRLTKRIRHNNQTGRWLSIFRASWLPHSDDLFVVGNVDKYPRTIQVFDKDMNICHQLQSINLTTITSINVFHPFKPALAGGNSSGKVYVFL